MKSLSLNWSKKKWSVTHSGLSHSLHVWCTDLHKGPNGTQISLLADTRVSYTTATLPASCCRFSRSLKQEVYFFLWSVLPWLVCQGAKSKSILCTAATQRWNTTVQLYITTHWTYACAWIRNVCLQCEKCDKAVSFPQFVSVWLSSVWADRNSVFLFVIKVSPGKAAFEQTRCPTSLDPDDLKQKPFLGLALMLSTSSWNVPTCDVFLFPLLFNSCAVQHICLWGWAEWRWYFSFGLSQF